MINTQRVLRKLGLHDTVKGFSYIVYGTQLIMQDSSYIQKRVKRLYPDIARHFDTNAACVEHNIRHAITVIWNNGNKEYLNEIADYKLVNKPTNGELFDIIVAYLQEHAENVG